jgi:hypothetical protein
MKYLLLTLAVMSTQWLAAQAKIVSIFNLIPSADKSKLVIKKIGTKYTTKNNLENMLPVQVSATNLEIIDEGTGGGTLTYQAKLLKDKKGKDILLFSRWLTDGVSNEPIIKLYDAKGKTLNMADAIPSFDKSSFFANGSAPADIETNELYNQYHFHYDLAGPLNTIAIIGGFYSLTSAATDGDANAKAIAKKIKPILLRWDSNKEKMVK